MTFSTSKSIPYAREGLLGLDHDQLLNTASDKVLRQQKITSITDDQRMEIEKKTRGQLTSIYWLEVTCKRLQASNFGLIYKATGRMDFTQLAVDLTGINKFQSKASKHGQQHGPGLAFNPGKTGFAHPTVLNLV